MTPINRFLKNYSAVGSLLQRKKEFSILKIVKTKMSPMKMTP